MKKIRLGDIATLITKGTTPTTIGFSFVDTGVNFVKIESIGENGEFLPDKFARITDECDKKLRRSQLEENDILFSIAGAIGRTAIVPSSILPANTNQALAIIRIPQNAINLRFVLYALQSQAVEEQSEKQKQGVAQLNLSLKNIADILIPLVSSEKQDEIVRNLAAIDAAIALRKEQIRLIDQLVKSRFVEMFGDNETNPFGWKQSRVGDCCTLKSGTSLPAEVENEGGPIPYVKVGDMNYPGNERYITTSSRYVSLATAGNGIFEVGSIIFPKRGGAIGTNKKRMTKLPISADLNIMGVSSKGVLLPEYLLVYFDMIDLGALSDGSSVPQINNKNIAPLRICLPPMELQKEFAAFVAEVDKSKLAVKQSLEKLETLKKSLMQQYFG